jgi:phage FluMu gp28-like protein
LDDPDGRAQEFECQFLDTQTVLLPYDLIAFGRSRDLSVAWSMAKMGDVLQTVEVLEMDRMSTPAQVELLKPRIRQARRVCLDYT